MADRVTKAEFRMIDLEARSRRNNLIFLNIPEPQNEKDSECEQALLYFLSKNLGKTDQQLHNTVFQCVHRLGQPRGGGGGAAPNGEAWRPRPIIVGFRDYKCRQELFGKSKRLKGTSYAIHEDCPAEIRSARGKLWGDFCKARSENRKARIVYPAKLIVWWEQGSVFMSSWASDVTGLWVARRRTARFEETAPDNRTSKTWYHERWKVTTVESWKPPDHLQGKWSLLSCLGLAVFRAPRLVWFMCLRRRVNVAGTGWLVPCLREHRHGRLSTGLTLW